MVDAAGTGAHASAWTTDAYNLCWKLAAVLEKRAGDALLDTYTAELRPVNLNTIETVLKMVGNQANMSSALGLSPGKSAEENWVALRLFWDDDAPGAGERRHEFNEWVGANTVEYHQHGLDFGYTYDSAAVVPDGTPAPESPDEIRLHVPSTRRVTRCRMPGSNDPVSGWRSAR